jgi:hypothetical protein
MQVIVQVRSVYGNEMIYPVCENAKRFASLTGKKTLSQNDLRDIEALGFKVFAQGCGLTRYAA